MYDVDIDKICKQVDNQMVHKQQGNSALRLCFEIKNSDYRHCFCFLLSFFHQQTSI